MEQSQCASRPQVLLAAFRVTIPVLTGYLCLGVTYGLLMQSRGYGPFWSTLMSLFCYGGSIQYIAVTLLVSAFDPLQAFLLALLVNARHVFYGLALLEKYRGLGAVRFPMICMLTDETFSLISTVEPPPGIPRKQFYFWISLLDYSYWVIATALGGILGGLLTFNSAGMDFVLTALFVVLFMEQWKKTENRPAGCIGLACGALALLAFGDNMIIPAMVLIMAALLGGRRRLCS